MAEINNMLDHMKEHAEETFKHYAEKEHWDAQDLKCAKEAAELYDKLQTIQMNTGIWENMKESGDYSFARYPHISYGGNDQSYMRGRGADGRYMSRGYEPHWDGGYPQESYGRGYSYGDQSYRGGMSYGNPGNNQGNTTSMHSVKDQAIQRLEQLMDSAKSEYEREEIRKMIQAVENQKR